MKDLVVFIGESGSGKNFLIDQLIYRYPEIHVAPQTSTRPMREGEWQGHPYNFISKEQFLQEIKDKTMAEFTNFNGWYYGTRIEDLKEDTLNVLSANPAAARTLLKNPELNVHIVRVFTEDKIRLIRSLEREKYPDVREILRRYDADKKDFAFLDVNYYTVNNNHESNVKTFIELADKQMKRWHETKKDN